MQLSNFIKDIKLSDSEVWVYGLGTTGRLLLDLFDLWGLHVERIVVGDGYKKSLTYRNINIYEKHEVYKGLNKVKILYTVKQDIHSILSGTLWEKEQIVDLSSTEFYMQLLYAWYNHFFEIKGVKEQINKDEVLDIKGVKFYNPRLYGNAFYESFISECGDLLLPPVWHTYDRIDEGAYEDGEIKIRKDDVVIDCGANIGLFSSVAAWRGAKVYAFEPVGKVFNYLEKQSMLYPENIIPVNAAVSNYCGEAEMAIDIDEHMTEGTMLHTEMQNGMQKESVTCVTLDDFVKNNKITHVDFIKADIEGCEREMLLGAKFILKNYTPHLSICTYHKKDDKEVLEKIILDANPNYKIIHKWKKLYAYV